MESLSSFKYLFKRKFAHMALLGFSAGIPYFLIFSSLSLWLGQVGVEKSSITYFSWAALGYSFKFLWSPLVDRLPLPVLSNWLGKRRGWLLLTQLLVISAIIWMALIDPANGSSALTFMAFATVLLGFSAATQDIVVDAWRIEAANEKDIAILSSVYFIGYRTGMILSGAGALLLVSAFGSTNENYLYSAWRNSYLIMSAFMGVGVLATFIIKEPQVNEPDFQFETKDYFSVLLIFIFAVISFILVYSSFGSIEGDFKSYLRSLFSNSAFISFLIIFIKLSGSFVLALLIGKVVYKSKFVNKTMVRSTYVEPVKDLLIRHKKYVWLLVGIICLYRISDIVMGVVANLFYQEMGFDLNEIASIVKTFGVFMTLTGGLLGGFAVVRFGIIKVMIVGAILSALTNLLFMIMAYTGKSILFLVFMISADNLSQGFALTAFISFLSLLVNKHFTAVQYAMFSSVMTLFPKILGGYSGGMVDAMGFANFFLMTAVIGIPVVWMLANGLKNSDFMENFKKGKESVE